MGAKRLGIVSYLNTKLAVSEILDSSSNGLQVEGAPTIERVGLAVDACLTVYKKAVLNNCQMLVVHHGLVWNGIKYVVGRTYEHIRYLIDNGLNLYAAHLPLDRHNELGNNIELARLLLLKSVKPFGVYNGVELGFMGELKKPLSSEDISRKMQSVLNGSSVILPFGREVNKTVGILSGGGSGVLNEAIEKRLDCFVTGEGDYSNYHIAEEAGINVIYLGHYHSEQLGVLALGKMIEKKFDVETVYLDEPPKENRF